MKTDITEMGWKETTVKHFVIKSFHKHALNTSVEDWIKSNQKLKLKKGMRSHCSCCKKSWYIIDGMINCVMTDKGNQVVCDSCFDKLGGNL